MNLCLKNAYVLFIRVFPLHYSPRTINQVPSYSKVFRSTTIGNQTRDKVLASHGDGSNTGTEKTIDKKGLRDDMKFLYHL